MMACPSNTRFSRVFPSAEGVLSIMAGMRPFAAFMSSDDESKRDRRQRTVDFQVPVFLLNVL
jgi:hypothetical protein